MPEATPPELTQPDEAEGTPQAPPPRRLGGLIPPPPIDKYTREHKRALKRLLAE